MREYTLLRQNDPEVFEAVMAETARQRNKIELIASENFVSETVMEANGTTLTNKKIFINNNYCYSFHNRTCFFLCIF